MKINFIDLQTQYQTHKAEIQQAIHQVLENGQYIMGQAVGQLETELANYVGSAHAISCASGTDALLLALMALDVKAGDEVITTPFSFIATAEVIALLGATPVFVDIDATTYNIQPEAIAAKITARTKVIMPVSLYGQPADFNEINAIAKTYSERLGHKIFVIEDAAQSFGASYHGQPSCHLSDIACTSFFPSKPLGCYGDGGAVFTDNEEIAKKIKAIRIHGQTKRYYHEYVGINGRMDTMQAAILSVKLKYFAEEVAARHRIAERYHTLLAAIPGVQVPVIKADRTSVYAQYSIRVKNREQMAAYLQQQNVPTAVHYPIPLHLQPCLQAYGGKVGDHPIAEAVANEIMSLPMSPYLTEQQQDYIVQQIKHAMQSQAVSA